MECKTPITAPNGMTVNCNSCMPCRINHTSAWSLRCIYELQDWDCASFITLTYDNEHLPGDFGLNPKDWQAFKEAMRYDLKIRGRKFRYFMCGEYGDDTTHSPAGIKHGRPHFHAILFGVDPNPYDDKNKDRDLIIQNWPKCDPVRFKWNPKGNNAIDFVNREDIQYVCGYTQKKIKGEAGKEMYGDRLPPYQKQSNGIGLNYFMQNKDRFIEQGFCYLNGRKIAIPRYFREKAGIEQNDLIKPMKKKQLESDVRFLEDEFEKWLIKRGRTPGTQHPDVLSHLFEVFYTSHSYSLAKQVEDDFHHRQRLKGVSKL